MRCGGLSLELCLQREAESVQVGSGALQAADANRSFLPSLLMPRFYSAVYRWESDLAERVRFVLPENKKTQNRGSVCYVWCFCCFLLEFKHASWDLPLGGAATRFEATNRHVNN